MTHSRLPSKLAPTSKQFLGKWPMPSKKKSFDSHGMFIDHNTAFWYVLLEEELSPEYQWSPTDRQIEWEYHQGSIHISCFSIGASTPLFCSILPQTLRFSDVLFSPRLFQSFPDFSLLSPLAVSYTPANVLVCNRRQSSRSSQFMREHKNLIRRVLFLKGSNSKTMIRRCIVSRSVCVFLWVILVLCIHPCATLTIIGKGNDVFAHVCVCGISKLSQTTELTLMKICENNN